MLFEFFTKEDWLNILLDFAEHPSLFGTEFNRAIAESLTRSCSKKIETFSPMTSFSKKEYAFLASALWQHIFAVEAADIDIDTAPMYTLADKLATLAEA